MLVLPFDQKRFIVFFYLEIQSYLYNIYRLLVGNLKNVHGETYICMIVVLYDINSNAGFQMLLRYMISHWFQEMGSQNKLLDQQNKMLF